MLAGRVNKKTLARPRCPVRRSRPRADRGTPWAVHREADEPRAAWRHVGRYGWAVRTAWVSKGRLRLLDPMYIRVGPLAYAEVSAARKVRWNHGQRLSGRANSSCDRGHAWDRLRDHGGVVGRRRHGGDLWAQRGWGLGSCKTADGWKST